MSNPTPTVSDESPLPTQPIVGVAQVHARDTEHDSPSQQIGMRPSWPKVNAITDVVDAAELQSTTGYYGGPMPDHSFHWNQYFSELWNILPSGGEQRFLSPPDPSQLTSMVAESQNMVTGNHTDPWENLQQTFSKMWRKGAPASTYKNSTP